MGDGKKNNTQFYKHDPSDLTKHLALTVANKLVIHSDSTMVQYLPI